MNNFKFKNIKTLISLISFSFILLSGGQISNAQMEKGSILFVSPFRVTIETNEKVQLLNVSNKSDKTRRYSIEIVNQVMKPDGSTHRVENFEYSAKRMLRFVPKRFTLDSGERQTLRVMAIRPKDLPDGDYHSHLLLREVPLQLQNVENLKTSKLSSGARFEIRALYGVGVPIVVENGNIHSSIEIETAELKSDENKKTLSIKFNRSGNAEASVMMETKLSQPGFADIDLVQKQWVRLYREVENVEKNFDIQLPEGRNLKNGTIKISLIKDPNTNAKSVIVEKSITIK